MCQLSTVKRALPTAALLQQLLPLTVSVPSFFYSGCSHEGVDRGKVELSLSIPPALALRICPHFWVLFVYLSRYAILVGNVAISVWRSVKGVDYSCNTCNAIETML